jgi:hypothetical protein
VHLPAAKIHLKEQAMTDAPRGDERAPDEPSEATTQPSARATEASRDLPDPNDEIPVPIVMSPAEVDERAQVVETLREEEGVATPPEQTNQEP